MTAEVPLSKDVANQYIGDMLKMLPGAVLYREPWSIREQLVASVLA